MPILWSPSEEQEAALEQDWQELQDMICLGQVERITAKVGQVLQLRPKAADGSALTNAVGVDGQLIQTRPRGYYLRKNFTQSIIQQYFS
jgi:DNA mismatch repair protein MutH